MMLFVLLDPSESQLDQDELEQLTRNATGINFRPEVDEKQETLVQLMCLLSDTKLVREEIEAQTQQSADRDDARLGQVRLLRRSRAAGPDHATGIQLRGCNPQCEFG
jgi:hypothetical protein